MTTPTAGPPSSGFQLRVDAADWTQIAAALDELGCALTPPLLSPADSTGLIGLYDHDDAFRSTVLMGRYRFGEGEYRYLADPLPDSVDALRHALYPKLLARRPRPLVGDVSPGRSDQAHPADLEVRTGRLERSAPRRLWRPRLSPPSGRQSHRTRCRPYRRRVPARRATPPRPVAGHRYCASSRAGARVHHSGPSCPRPAGLVGSTRPPRCVGAAFRCALYPRHPLP
jgi:hypothetical protein